jgi:hypothetical protein
MIRNITFNLIYFKTSGKYYTEAEYVPISQSYYDAIEEVRNLKEKGELPGLVKGATEFNILINLLHDPDDVPYLIINQECCRNKEECPECH